MKKMCLLFISLLGYSALFAQSFRLSGKTIDTYGNSIPDVSITIIEIGKTIQSDKSGDFSFPDIPEGKYELIVTHTNHQKLHKMITVSKDSASFTLVLKPKILQLAEVEIKENFAERRSQEESMNIETIKRDFLLKNLGGSLMKSLERLPGVKTIGIGSGQSKPLIRGMGFNRVVVIDKGMKHEGQQWGADHGLELDQYAAREVEIIKGSASFAYGSDAIAGIIDTKPPLLPPANSLGGSVDLTGKSNNAFYGTSVNLYGRNKNWFFDSRVTYQKYSDYKVPTDSVYVYDYAVALKDGFLRNTAGGETDLNLSAGYVNEKFRSVFYFSNINSKSGFFANAHGLEPRRVDVNLHDASSNDILTPSQQVNHFKIINRTDFRIGLHHFKIDLGFQHNFREEFSPYVNHGYMPPIYPSNRNVPSYLEREFDKSVFAANFKDLVSIGKHELNFGLNTEYQNNKISGWSFLVPAFRQFTLGAFIYDKFKITDEILLLGALRYDFGHISMDKYNDWFLSPVAINGMETDQYLTRANDLTRNFNSFVYSVGMNFNRGKFSLKWNLGKSFRMPIAKELGANGVNYHYFSYEKGNPNLSPEISYQADFGLSYKTQSLSINFSPFYNYFPNYIYLNPTALHDYDYGAGNQVFEYAQSKVMRYGAEFQIKANLIKNISVEALAEYLFAKQLSGDKKGYVLPFSPPPSVLINLSYNKDFGSKFKESYLSIDYRLTSRQDNIVPPEKKTDGYGIINIQAGTKIDVGGRAISVNLQAQNLLDKKYLNHTSFYRLIELPEAGHNLILSLNIPFSIRENSSK
ncbi:TonB-dependent receptor [Pedobacter aquatilis]|uniref:TonB-dependent receptor n=1 Tax=Pedobacter aquatilis TaxID=351343 RepID=UPI0025B553E8|nr:TonB-dependent receptor [Pedobacter aquatilis]MDN3588831.1 TonB-dependent receptor [Pedobacter aquatilis]